jgi:dCMP deaminase
MRISKDRYYLEIAKTVALRSPCLRRKYGAVIVKEDAILSTGYNGPARGVINCFEVGCIKDILNLPHGKAYDECPAVHAEENAILNAARSGSCVFSSTLYLAGFDRNQKIVSAIPCQRCKRAIINAGISKVVILKDTEEIETIDVKEWVKEDTQNYLEKIKTHKI